jgi:hypothetical protein
MCEFRRFVCRRAKCEREMMELVEAFDRLVFSNNIDNKVLL